MGITDSDLYQTLKKPTDVQVYKEKGSKFLGVAFPVEDVEQVEVYLNQLKKEHPKARHWCYAWQLGVDKANFRYNDDGEPNNSAGKPIYGQIQSFELTNVLVVVVRYFGGTKLGVGGLVTAYKTAAKLSLDHADIVTKMLMENMLLEFDYMHMNKVMRIIKEYQLQILNQKMELNCLFNIAVRKNKAEEILKTFKDLRCLDAKIV